MNIDCLRQAAVAFQKLLPVKYRIILGKKGKSFELNIAFKEDNFFHLSGLHKISSHLLKLPRVKIFHSILKGEISDATFNNYVSSPEILERIKILSQLEKLLDDEQTSFFKYDSNKVAFSKISADYLAKGTVNDEQIFFSFFVKNGVKGDLNYYANSIFPLKNYDFSKNQTKYTILLKEKFLDGNATTLYRHKKY